jgi:hypothetical protein
MPRMLRRFFEVQEGFESLKPGDILEIQDEIDDHDYPPIITATLHAREDNREDVGLPPKMFYRLWTIIKTDKEVSSS